MSPSDPKRHAPRPMPVIGWREWVHFPSLGLPPVKAKIDTGARTSSLHAFDVELEERDGIEHVRFWVHPAQRTRRGECELVLPLIDRREVRNSGGGAELRPVVEMQVSLFDRPWTIEVTLTRRDVMGFRMLLGRQAVRGRMLIDPGRSFMAGKPDKAERLGGGPETAPPKRAEKKKVRRREADGRKPSGRRPKRPVTSR